MSDVGSELMMEGSGPVSALPGTAGGVEVAAGSAPSGDRAWAALAVLLCGEIARLREYVEKQLGQSLPFPPAEVVAVLRAFHDDERLATVIERLVDL